MGTTINLYKVPPNQDIPTTTTDAQRYAAGSTDTDICKTVVGEGDVSLNQTFVSDPYLNHRAYSPLNETRKIRVGWVFLPGLPRRERKKLFQAGWAGKTSWAPWCERIRGCTGTHGHTQPPRSSLRELHHHHYSFFSC